MDQRFRNFLKLKYFDTEIEIEMQTYTLFFSHSIEIETYRHWDRKEQLISQKTFLRPQSVALVEVQPSFFYVFLSLLLPFSVHL